MTQSGTTSGTMEQEFDRDPPKWRRYLRFWGSDVRADVSDEIGFHLDELITTYIAAGLSPEEARRKARARFGDVDRIATTLRTLALERETAMRRTEWLDALRRDLGFAMRQLRQRPGFTLVALLTLALGIGATTAIFTAVNAVLLRPLPVQDLDRLVFIQGNLPSLNLHRTPLDPNDALALTERTEVFEAVAGLWPRDPILTGFGDPQPLSQARTVGSYFDVFGLTPAVGRFYRPDEAENDRHLVAVLSHDFWQELGGQSEILGRTLTLNGQNLEVIGVAPPGFRYPRGVHLWSPYPLNPTTRVNRGRLVTTTIARVRPDVTPQRLSAELDLASEALHPSNPNDRANRFLLTSQTFIENFAGDLRTVLLVLLAAVGFVLLIACANVASLQLVHGAGRTREMAVRSALGAGRGVIVRQLLVENLALSVGGGLLGLLVGVAILRLLSASGAPELPALQELRLDGTVLAFTAVTTILSGLFFGVIPARRAGRVDVQEVLREGGRSGSMGAHRSRLLQAGVVTQMALTLVLLLGSGLMIRSLGQLLAQQPGFNAERVSTMRVTLAGPRYARGADLTAFWEAALARLRALPGFDPVGLISALPFSGTNDSSPFTIVGRAADPSNPALHANLHGVLGDYFRAMGIPLLRGRVFEARDTRESPLVAVIDEQLARQYFPGEDPVGKLIAQGGQEAVIIGVVGTVSQGALGEPPKATIYYSQRQHEWYATMYMAVRSALPLSAILAGVRENVRAIDPDVAVYEPRTLEDRVNLSLAPRRLTMTVLSALGALSLFLAMLGLYGVISYAVSQRGPEFGIRVALGAQSRQVLMLVVRQGAVLALIGIVAGLAAAYLSTRALGGLLFGISPHDPLTFVAACAVLALIAMLASYLPARRATRVSPTEALRSSG